jgi:hypothetical protein
MESNIRPIKSGETLIAEVKYTECSIAFMLEYVKIAIPKASKTTAISHKF